MEMGMMTETGVSLHHSMTLGGRSTRGQIGRMNEKPNEEALDVPAALASPGHPLETPPAPERMRMTDYLPKWTERM